MKTFFKNVRLFGVTSDQFKTLQSKSINFFKK